jgi:hypothetical protein
VKVPPWDCYTPSDKRAFIDFIIDRLGELAEVEHGSQEYDDDVRLYIAMLRLEQAHDEAREAGIAIPEMKRRRGAQRRDRNNEELLLESAIRGGSRKLNRYSRNIGINLTGWLSLIVRILRQKFGV